METTDAGAGMIMAIWPAGDAGTDPKRASPPDDLRLFSSRIVGSNGKNACRWSGGFPAWGPGDALRGGAALADEDVGPADGIGLADAIGMLRDELLRARAAGAGADIQLPVESMTVVLTVQATKSFDGKAGFKVPVVELELGGGGSRERSSGQTVTVVFGQPVDRD